MLRRLIFLAVGLGTVVPALAQGAAAPVALSPTWARLERLSLNYAYPGSQLKDHVYSRSARYFAQGDAARDALQTPEAVRSRQAEIRRFMLDSIGGLPPSDTPLNARVTGTVAGNGFTIEKLIFEARPRHYVTANLYLPAQRPGRTGAVLFLSGHHNTAKQVAEYQIVCQTLAQAGLIVLAQDPIGQGERLSYYDPATKRALIRAGTGEHEHAGNQSRLLGDQIARYFLHDAMRGIDYLVTRPEVDPARIGVTGNSGGGTQTSLVMMADPRVAAAAPATFITSREAYQWTGQAQDAEQNWFGFTRAGFDHEDILLAMAPKPVLVLAVTSDFFPLEGTRRTVERARRIWALQDRRDHLGLFEDQSRHHYTPAMARAAAQFFTRHLLDRPAVPAGLQPAVMPEEKLHATQSGQVSGELPGAEFVHDANVARLAALEAARRALPAAEQKARATAWLKDAVFRDRERVELNPRRLEERTALDDLQVDVMFWYSHPRLANLGLLFRPLGQTEPLPVTLALWDDGTQALSRHAVWIREQCARGRAVFVVNLAGMGPLKPDPVNHRTEAPTATFRKLVDDLSFIGDSLVALRTYETLRALDVLATVPGVTANRVHVYGHGRIGVHGRLAVLLDSRFSGYEWPERFRYADVVRDRNYDTTEFKSFLLPGVLRSFDVDEF